MKIQYEDSKKTQTVIGSILYDDNQKEVGEVVEVKNNMVTAEITDAQFYKKISKGYVIFSTVGFGMDKVPLGSTLITQ